MATKEKSRFRLRNPKVTRVDLVDRGANQDAHIVLAKGDLEGKERAFALADRISAATEKKPKESKPKSESKKPERVEGQMAERIRQAMTQGPEGQEQPAEPGMGPGLPRPKGEKQRIVRIRPEDFEVTEMNGNMMEWAIPEDKLPEGVEEAIMTMAQSADSVMFQWMIDPLAGPPAEGQAKTAAEAFMAMRAALTNQGAMDPMEMLGGFPGEKKIPTKGGKGGNPQMTKPSPMAKAIAEVRKSRSDDKNQDETVQERLGDTLNLIVKGLVEVDVFNETATGSDLLDILPRNLVEEITSKLSAS